jgi:hypothetical protein
MTASFSNHSGTMSSSFAIGKGGFKIVQGTSDPAGVVAPTGSLYVLKNAGGSSRVYQIDALGNWYPLLSVGNIIAGTGISVSNSAGIVTITANPTKYKTTFTSSSLSSGKFTVNHALNEEYPGVVVYDNNRKQIIPDQVTSVDANNVTLDLTSYTVNSTWTVTVLSGV